MLLALGPLFEPLPNVSTAVSTVNLFACCCFCYLSQGCIVVMQVCLFVCYARLSVIFKFSSSVIFVTFGIDVENHKSK